MIVFVLPVFGQEGTNVSEVQTDEPNPKQAVDILLLDNELSVLYSRGGYLLYDCQSKHWVCTSKNEKVRCDNARKFAIKENEENLPCAIIKLFDDEKSCQKKQQIIIDSAMENRFCMHPERRKLIKPF
jgi:hypothetical protein